MFKDLRENSLFYVLEKKGEPTMRVCQVVSATKTPPEMGQYGHPYGVEPTIDVSVKSGEATMNFTKLPPTLSIANFGTDGVVVAESADAMYNEVLSMERASAEALKMQPYHEKVMQKVVEMKKQLNPQYAKEIEREEKIGVLEERMGGIESTLGDMMGMLSSLVQKPVKKTKTEDYGND